MPLGTLWSLRAYGTLARRYHTRQVLDYCCNHDFVRYPHYLWALRNAILKLTVSKLASSYEWYLSDNEAVDTFRCNKSAIKTQKMKPLAQRVELRRCVPV